MMKRFSCVLTAVAGFFLFCELGHSAGFTTSSLRLTGGTITIPDASDLAFDLTGIDPAGNTFRFSNGDLAFTSLGGGGLAAGSTSPFEALLTGDTKVFENGQQLIGVNGSPFAGGSQLHLLGNLILPPSQAPTLIAGGNVDVSGSLTLCDPISGGLPCTRYNFGESNVPLTGTFAKSAFSDQYFLVSPFSGGAGLVATLPDPPLASPASPAAVPEPMSLILFGSGVVSLPLFRRLSRSSKSSTHCR
jgi:hypothetical protein